MTRASLPAEGKNPCFGDPQRQFWPQDPCLPHSAWHTPLPEPWHKYQDWGIKKKNNNLKKTSFPLINSEASKRPSKVQALPWAALMWSGRSDEGDEMRSTNGTGWKDIRSVPPLRYDQYNFLLVYRIEGLESFGGPLWRPSKQKSQEIKPCGILRSREYRRGWYNTAQSGCVETLAELLKTILRSERTALI